MSLLEVTFSIGVVMLGLLGVAALLPVAGSLATKGVVADSAARRGSDAIRDFHVRSMGNPSTWRWFDPSMSQFRPIAPSELAAGFSFCLDPRFVALGDESADHPRRNGFPYLDDLYGAGVILSMPRITLAPSLAPPSAAVIMGRLQADQVFSSDDDLVFDLPADRTLGPVQNFSREPEATGPPLRRNNNGNISWLATVVPKLDRLGNLTDAYTLSVVVCARRILDRTLTNENLANERVVVVSQFYSGQPALGGGDLRLATRRNNRDDLELRSGDWVMLSGTQQRLPPLQPIQVHAWYRVVNAGEGPVFDSSSSTWFRDVTLTGPDWNWGFLGSNTPTQYVTPTQVTILRGAVAVFEKTIRLETSSLWTR